MRSKMLSPMLLPALLPVVLAAVLAGCSSLPPRHPLPEALAGDVVVGGYQDVRFWGDTISTEIRRAVRQQYAQVRAAALAGKTPGAADRAAFIAISGGGGDGAYAAGFIKGWTERGDRPRFEIVTGVSTGSLAAPFVFLGPSYDPQLEEIFTSYSDDDLYSSDGLFGLIGGRSVASNGPLRKLVERYVTDEVVAEIAAQYRLGRRLLVLTTNIDAQRPVIWDLTGIAASDQPDRRARLVQLLLASAAIPAIFPPERIAVNARDGQAYDELHVDGGVTAQVFFGPPQLRLGHFEKEYFGHHRDRAFYAIRNGRLGPDYQPAEEKTLSLAQRALATLVKQQSLSDLQYLEKTVQANGDRLRYTAVPPDFHADAKSQFDRAYMRALFDRGVANGRRGEWRQDTPLTPVFAN